ncbi:GTP cyclohydrolase II [Sutcliffiella cohnii]|uniref:GTP cyclohydrolase II n=1 Tax=Sutcliffiella cohnii TaxID=33932 RepID=A0A223KPC7_9BACI|nr:GTP cyclohydrolase II [Sutcliffiella cohnii]AST91360.1 GTP cyclohydrolase [Sutcliffiella cohnii]MED4015084.1 GTP cyclohydrolase II [Sutcliffiella cohnii]
MNDNILKLLDEKIEIIHEHEKPNMAVVGPVKLPVQLDEQEVLFNWYTWLNLDGLPSEKNSLLASLPKADLASSQQSSVLVYGDFAHADNALIRFHSICHTGDIFGSKKCDCGYQLRQSMKMIVENGSGAIFYIANHEGRGIGLFSKSLAYILQQEGFDTVEANEQLGFKDDSRSYEEAIRVLKSLRNKPVSLITNNPNKLASLRNYDIDITSHISLWGDVSVYNERYLQTKVEKSGHIQKLKVPM